MLTRDRGPMCCPKCGCPTLNLVTFAPDHDLCWVTCVECGHGCHMDDAVAPSFPYMPNPFRPGDKSSRRP